MNYPSPFNRSKKVHSATSNFCMPASLCRFVKMLLTYSMSCFTHPIEILSGPQGRQVAVSSDAPLVFHPSGSVIQAFHLHEGSLQGLLRGHIDTVNACCYNPVTQVGFPFLCLSMASEVDMQKAAHA